MDIHSAFRELFVVVDLAPQHQALGGLFQARDLLLLRLEHLLLPEQAHLFLEGIFRVASGEGDQLAIFHLGDLVHHQIEQKAVVRDDHNAAGVVPNQPFERGFALQVKVIIWLVQQQQVWLNNQQPRQPCQLLLPAAEHIHRKVKIYFTKAQPAQRGAHAAFVARPACFFVFRQQAFLTVERARQQFFVTVNSGVCKLRLHPLQIALDRLQRIGCRKDRLPQRAARL